MSIRMLMLSVTLGLGAALGTSGTATGSAFDAPIPDPAPGQDLKDKLRRVKQVLRDDRASGMERRRAIEAFEGEDSAEAAEILVGLFQELEKKTWPIEARRRKAIHDGDRQKVAPLRAELDPLRHAQDRILTVLNGYTSPAALDWLFENVVKNEKLPESLRMKLIKVHSERADVDEANYLKALDRARKPGQIVLLLNGVAKLGTKAKDAAPAVLKHLRNKDATVREAAAWAAAAIAVPESIEPLIDQLGAEKGRTARRFAAALEMITRQKFGLSVNAWRRWFADNGEVVTSGAVPLGGGETSFGPNTDSGYFHGIPQEGHSIVYVIDNSGSMREPVELGRGYGRRRGQAVPGMKSRLELCQEELIKALGLLAHGTKFNIVHYAYVAELYHPKMLTADEKTVKKAQDWVESLMADGATNIYDGLERAFEIAGRGTKDQYYDSKVETIFLLTDGRPQLPDGVWDSTDRIRDAVRRWNPYGKVVVHTIGMGKDVEVQFLTRLAEENGGQYVQR